MHNPNRPEEHLDFSMPLSSFVAQISIVQKYDTDDASLFCNLLALEVQKNFKRPEVQELLDETPTVTSWGSFVEVKFSDGDAFAIQKTFGLTEQILLSIKSGAVKPFDPKAGYVFHQYGPAFWQGKHHPNTPPHEPHMSGLFFGLRRCLKNRQEMRNPSPAFIIVMPSGGPRIDPSLN